MVMRNFSVGVRLRRHRMVHPFVAIAIDVLLGAERPLVELPSWRAGRRRRGCRGRTACRPSRSRRNTAASPGGSLRAGSADAPRSGSCAESRAASCTRSGRPSAESPANAARQSHQRMPDAAPAIIRARVAAVATIDSVKVMKRGVKGRISLFMAVPDAGRWPHFRRNVARLPRFVIRALRREMRRRQSVGFGD